MGEEDGQDGWGRVLALQTWGTELGFSTPMLKSGGGARGVAYAFDPAVKRGR